MRTGMLLLGLALAGSGCGKSKEREIFEERRAICLGLPPSRATLQAAVQELGPICTAECRADFVARAGTEACPIDGTTRVCRVTFGWIAMDQSLCGPFGCAYYCEAWVPAPPAQAELLQMPVCGARFLDEQPSFFCG